MTRLALFIDQANMWSTYKSAGKNIDMTLLLSYLSETYKWEIVLKAIYLAYPETDTRDYNVDGIHKYATFLKKWLDFLVRKKPLKRIVLKDDIWIPLKNAKWELVYQEKWNMDIELAIDVVSKNAHFDAMILLSGDSDFMPLVNFLRSRWKKTYIYSSEGHISKELRTGTDGYTDLLDVESIWWADLKSRNKKP